jgi:hypothetical protein
MKSSITGKEMQRMVKEEVLIFRKEEFPILYHYFLCEDSGEEFTDGAMDNLNVIQAYNQYRTQMGPVPLNFISIFEYAAMQDDIDITYQEFQNGGIGEFFKPHPNREFNASLFDEGELLTMTTIMDRFRNISTADIINLSHEEAAWSDSFNEKKKISYDYAFKLLNA